jgi:transcriptional regulator with XRE-family HTH domain
VTSARLTALCATLNLGETDIANLTGYSRGAVRKWLAGQGKPWPPFVEWLEAVAPRVARIHRAHPPPHRHRSPERPTLPPEAVAAALRMPRRAETRAERQAAIAAAREARREGIA